MVVSSFEKDNKTSQRASAMFCVRSSRKFALEPGPRQHPPVIDLREQGKELTAELVF